MALSLKDIIVISHANCTDGWSSIHSMYSIFKDTADYFTFGHNQAEKKLGSLVPYLHNKTVIVVDYALPINVWHHLQENQCRIITLDHHHSAWLNYHKETSDIIKLEQLTVELLNKKTNITVFDMDHSGAALALRFATLFGVSFTPSEIKLSTLIQDVDLEKFLIPESNHLYASIGNKAKFSDCLETGCLPIPKNELMESINYYQSVINNLDNVLTNGKIKHAMFEEQVADLAKNANDVTLTICNDKKHTFHGKIINANSLFAPAIGTMLAEQANGLAMVYNIIGNDVKISFRSVHDYDCSVIAKLLGGGGHQQASACVVDLDTLNKILKNQIIYL